MNRREQVCEEIKKSNKAISATQLSILFGVSRQVIVGDIALLRAEGINILSTPRGYIFPQNDLRNTYKIAVKHEDHQLQDELYTIIDLGGFVMDVIVDHPLYGQLTGALQLQSRYDVDTFIEKVKKEKANSLSLLTHGCHIHTIFCPSQEVYQRILDALSQKGYLL